MYPQSVHVNCNRVDVRWSIETRLERRKGIQGERQKLIKEQQRERKIKGIKKEREINKFKRKEKLW
jgi:hypothetical protein